MSVGYTSLYKAGRSAVRKLITLALVTVLLLVGLIAGTNASSNFANGGAAIVNEEAEPQAWLPKLRFFWLRDWGGLMYKATYGDGRLA